MQRHRPIASLPVRLAVLADIHGNAWALEAVLKDIRGRSVDAKVNLGDSLYGPLSPQRTWELLRASSFLAVRGNEDRLLFEPPDPGLGNRSTLDFVLGELDRTAIDWMKSLPKTLELGDLLLVHGTPASDTEYLLEDVSRGVPDLRPPEAIAERLAGFDHSLVLCGHSHLPRCVTSVKGRVLVNPGSVGCPAYTDDHPVPHRMENRSPEARYALVERTDRGWTVEHRVVPYPHEIAAARAREAGREDWFRWLSTGLAARTG